MVERELWPWRDVFMLKSIRIRLAFPVPAVLLLLGIVTPGSAQEPRPSPYGRIDGQDPRPLGLVGTPTPQAFSYAQQSPALYDQLEFKDTGSISPPGEDGVPIFADLTFRGGSWISWGGSHRSLGGDTPTGFV